MDTQQTFTEGVAQNLRSCTWECSDGHFLGWNTESDGNGTSYEDGALFTASEDITLYAQWGM